MEDAKEVKSLVDFLHINTPTAEQVEALKQIEAFVQTEDKRDFFILCGSAGTGKTTLLSALTHYLDAVNIPFSLSAPTGRAARIVHQKTQATAGTLHSMIYRTEKDENTDKMKFYLRENRSLLYTVHIVDEASMVASQRDQGNAKFESDNNVLSDLIAFVKSGNVKNKVLFVGDRYQLPPVFEDDSKALDAVFLANAYNLTGMEFRLTEVKRQSDGSEIITVATEVRDAIDRGDSTAPWPGKRSQDIYRIAQVYAQDFLEYGPSEAISIHSSNKAAGFFNDLVRQKLFPFSNNPLEPGDLLMAQQSWFAPNAEGGDSFSWFDEEANALKLHNGDQLLVISTDPQIDTVEGLHFQAARVRRVFSEDSEPERDLLVVLNYLIKGLDPKQLWVQEQKLILARKEKNERYRDSGWPSDDRYVGALRAVHSHGVNCYKAQGGEWNKVFVNTLGVPSLKWQYTAITRGKEKTETFGKS